MSQNIVISNLAITALKADVMVFRHPEDKVLIERICDFRKEMERDGFEVWKRWDNVIISEAGWYFAIYQDELAKVKKPLPPMPFLSPIDGRMKIRVKRKDNGVEEIEDLATMMATGYLPNPNGYQYVKFKDGDVKNCQAKNLYWSEEP